MRNAARTVGGCALHLHFAACNSASIRLRLFANEFAASIVCARIQTHFRIVSHWESCRI